MNLGATSCCGVGEIANIHPFYTKFGYGGSRELMKELAKQFFRARDRYIPDPNDNGRMVNNPQERQYYPMRCQFIFTDHHCAPHYIKGGLRTMNIAYGKAFARYILKNKLGSVTCSRRAKNPNSPNVVTAWIWTPDHENLEAFLNKLVPWKPKPDPVKKEPTVEHVPPTKENPTATAVSEAMAQALERIRAEKQRQAAV